MKKKYIDVLAALFTIIFAFLFGYFTKDIKLIDVDVLGGRFFPNILSIILGILGISLLITSLYKIKVDNNNIDNDVEIIEDSSTVVTKSYGKLKVLSRYPDIISIILLFIYTISMKYLGFIISSVIYLFLQMNVLSIYRKSKNYLLYGLVSVVVPIIVYYIFTQIFSLTLPEGILG
ncbi:MAG: tripartite tricarboxylate transporter TctB family protein [Tissierellaceae bacterium]|nr:tripartite tricarboxylate transporter TctB family protein [Tissierellaceae bacterium]